MIVHVLILFCAFWTASACPLDYCSAGLSCCPAPSWYIASANTRRSTKGYPNRTLIPSLNLTLPDVSLPSNDSFYCCMPGQLCSETIFCEPEVKGAASGGGPAVVAIVVVVGLALVGAFTAYCFLSDGAAEGVRSEKEKQRRDVMAQYRPKADPLAPRRVYNYFDLR